MKKLTFALGIGLLALTAVAFTACGGGGAATALRLEITSPTGRTISVDTPTQMVSGIVSDPAGTITVNDVEVAVDSDGSFSHDVELDYGSNRIVVAASIEGRDRPLTRTINVTRNLNLVLMSPEGVAVDPDEPIVTGENSIIIRGRVSDPDAQILITGDQVEVDDEGNFSSTVSLHYTLTTLNVTAMLEAVDAPVTTLVTVHRTP